MDIIQEKSVASEDGKRLLEQRNYVDAVKLLRQRIAEEPDGDSQALLALAYFLQEEYELAAKHYQLALKYDPNNQEWQEMLVLAQANAVAEVQVPVPDIYYFDRDKLLAKPTVPNGALPSPLPPAPTPGLSLSPLWEGRW